jgi:hypothetical protein
MTEPKVYAIINYFGGYRDVFARIKERYGNRGQLDYPGNPMVGLERCFSSRLDCLKKLLELQDAQHKRDRRRLLARIRSEEKKLTRTTTNENQE